MDTMETIARLPDADAAESQLIEHYKNEGSIAYPLRRLSRFEAMRSRMDLMEKAHADYRAGRYYATVLVLLSVMDGFVNDLDRSARRGLHARGSDDMVAWDSVVGHHLGLSHAHKTFQKGFYKTIATPTTELYRNGIIHGMLTDFDNDVVATKAWNRLFAVGEWADACNRRVQPQEPEPSLRETLASWRKIQDDKARLDAWQPRQHVLGSEDDKSEVVETCLGFLRTWNRGQWGLVGAYFAPLGMTDSSEGEIGRLAKDLYESYALTTWKPIQVRHSAAAVAHVDVELVVNDESHRTELRWIRLGDDGSIATEWEPGRWALAPYGPAHFLNESTDIEGSTGSSAEN